MGMGIGLSGSTYEQPQVIERVVEKTIVVKPGMPNPTKFSIEESAQIGRFLVVRLKYSGVTNFEGRKILVYEDITIDDFKDQGHADPHFSDNPNFHSPIARFEPTARGWYRAKRFAKMEAKK
jgi:hypothetical protein